MKSIKPQNSDVNPQVVITVQSTAAVVSPKSILQCTSRGQHALKGCLNVQNWSWKRPTSFLGWIYFWTVKLSDCVPPQDGGYEEEEGGGVATWCITVQFHSKQQVGSQPLWPGCHDNCELLLLLPWLPLLSAEPWCKLPVPAGSACQWRAKTGAPTLQARAWAFTLCLEGSQTLGLTQVPATHFRLAGQELLKE